MNGDRITRLIKIHTSRIILASRSCFSAVGSVVTMSNDGTVNTPHVDLRLDS